VRRKRQKLLLNISLRFLNLIRGRLQRKRTGYSLTTSFLTQDIPTNPFTVNEIKIIINHLNPKKAPGYDLITNKILKMLPETAIKYITQLCNAVVKGSFFSLQWKVAQIIMIQKPSKPTEPAESYRSISLLSVLSKLFEKLLLSRISIIMENYGLISDHQFGFRSKHATTDSQNRKKNKQ